jgi:hypothetical protein
MPSQKSNGSAMWGAEKCQRVARQLKEIEGTIKLNINHNVYRLAAIIGGAVVCFGTIVLLLEWQYGSDAY